MRKRYAPLGWPRRDPRHYRFPIPNMVWRYKLKPIEFVIFSYLCYHCTHDQDGVLAVNVVAESVHLTAGTTEKYLDALVNRGLITAEWSFVPDLQYANSKKFFTLPNEVFLLKLSLSAFMVYAYLLLIEDRRTHTCHPSYNTISGVAGLSRNTVMKNICALLEAELITMEHSSYFDKRGLKWKGNNLYTILPVSAAVDQIHQRQLRQLELDMERRRVRKRQEEYDYRPRTALCATSLVQSTPDPSHFSACAMQGRIQCSFIAGFFSRRERTARADHVSVASAIPDRNCVKPAPTSAVI